MTIAHSGTRFARGAFARGYAETGAFPVAPMAHAACRAIEESPLSGPRLTRRIYEAGRAEGRRASREHAHTVLYDFHSSKLRELLAPVLAALAVTELTAQVVAHAQALTAAGLTVVHRRRQIAALILLALKAHMTAEQRGALVALNAAGWAHATAQGRAEAQTSPVGTKRGGPPDGAKVAAAAVAALALVSDDEAQAAGIAWTEEQLNAYALWAAVEAGDGAAVNDAAKKVTAALVSSTAASKSYADALHKTLNQAFVAHVQNVAPTTLYRWVVNSGNPCPTCETLSAEGPWTASQLPTSPPLHPNCQCNLEVAGTAALVMTSTSATSTP